MAEVRYIPGRAQRPDDELADYDVKYKTERANERALAVKEREARFAKLRNELISRDLATKQAAFLVISVRNRLLALPAACSQKLADCTDAREVERLLSEQIREALSELSEMPLRVGDKDWMAKIK